MSLSSEELKQKIIDLIRKDREFRRMLSNILAEEYVTRKEIEQIIAEIKYLREDFNKKMAEFSKEIIELRRDFNNIYQEIKAIKEDIRALREENQRIWQEIKAIKEDIRALREENQRIWQEIKAIKEDIRALREDIIDLKNENRRIWEEIRDIRITMKQGFDRMDHRFERLYGLVSTLGGRWGIKTEQVFREAIQDLVKKAIGASVKHLVLFDAEGIVYGEPSNIDIDLAIIDKQHILVEIKSRIRKSDVTELLRISEVYEKEYKVKPDLVIVSPEIDKNAYDFAIKKNIKVYAITEDLLLGD